MAKATRSRRKAGAPRRRSGKTTRRRSGTQDWLGRLKRIAVAVTLRRVSLAVGILAGLILLGIGVGYWTAGRLDEIDRDARSRAILDGMKQGQAASEPRRDMPTEPKYSRIEDLPEYPRFTDNAPGQQRPSLEEPGRVGAGIARTAEGGQPWRRNAVAFRDDGKRPLIAIVIDDMGLDRARSSKVVALATPLTLSWLPYARDLREQAGAARARGHELMIHVPMEPTSPTQDPGPGALLLRLGRADLQQRLLAALQSFDGYVGINNHMGSRFTAERPGMELVLQTVKDRGLLFLDSRTSPDSVGDQIAQEKAIPSAVRHVFLDDVDSIDNVRAQLLETERLARRQGFAIAIGHPHDNTILGLSQWIPTLPDKGIALAPLTAIVIRRGRWQ